MFLFGSIHTPLFYFLFFRCIILILIERLQVNLKGPFGAQDRKTIYDKFILSYFNLLFEAPIGYDKLIILLILSCQLFIIFIRAFSWDRNKPIGLKRWNQFCSLFHASFSHNGNQVEEPSSSHNRLPPHRCVSHRCLTIVFSYRYLFLPYALFWHFRFSLIQRNWWPLLIPFCTFSYCVCSDAQFLHVFVFFPCFDVVMLCAAVLMPSFFTSPISSCSDAQFLWFSHGFRWCSL